MRIGTSVIACVVAAVTALASVEPVEARPRREAPARERAVEVDGALGSVPLPSLPPEARATWQLVQVGGPFPYPKDGIVFGNRERVLPAHARGYYREYTVRTPGSRDRGARRIVCGGASGRPPVHPTVCYYTGDHYATFARIVN